MQKKSPTRRRGSQDRRKKKKNQATGPRGRRKAQGGRGLFTRPPTHSKRSEKREKETKRKGKLKRWAVVSR